MAGETDSFEKHVTVEAGGAVGVFPRRHALFAGGVTLSAASLWRETKHTGVKALTRANRNIPPSARTNFFIRF